MHDDMNARSGYPLQIGTCAAQAKGRTDRIGRGSQARKRIKQVPHKEQYYCS